MMGTVGTNCGLTSLQIPEDWWMYEFKVHMCTRQDPHEFERCPYAHTGEKARRRHPSKYESKHCAYTRAKKACPAGDDCRCAHSLFEYWLHPDRFRTCFCSKGAACDRHMCFFAHSALDVRVVQPAGGPLTPGSITPGSLSPLTAAQLGGVDAGVLSNLLAQQQQQQQQGASPVGSRSPQGPPGQAGGLSPRRSLEGPPLSAIDRMLASVNLISTHSGSAPASNLGSGAPTPRSASPAIQPLSPGATLAAVTAGGYSLEGGARMLAPGVDMSEAVLSLSAWQGSQGSRAGLVASGLNLSTSPPLAAQKPPTPAGGRLVRSNSWVDEHAASREQQQAPEHSDLAALVGNGAAAACSPRAQGQGQGGQVGRGSPSRWQEVPSGLDLAGAPAGLLGTTAGALGEPGWAAAGPLAGAFSASSHSPVHSPVHAMVGGLAAGSSGVGAPGGDIFLGTSPGSSYMPIGGGLAAGATEVPGSSMPGGSPASSTSSRRAEAAVAALISQLDVGELNQVVQLLRGVLGV